MDVLSLRGILGDDSEHKSPPAMAAELLAEYRQRYQTFLEGCPFKPGDLVTPLGNSKVIGAGEPCVVLELRAGTPIFEGDTGTPGFGERLDMRIARFMSDSIVRFWAESVDYEPYSGGNS